MGWSYRLAYRMDFIDTTAPPEQISYLIEFWTDGDTITPDFDLDGLIDIDSNGTGILYRGFVTEDKELFLKRNPLVQVKLLSIDTIVFYDSLFTWQEMDFLSDLSNVDGNIHKYCSKKTIYIDIPHWRPELLSGEY